MIQKPFQTKCPLLLLACHLCAIVLLTSCIDRIYNSPEGYELSKPEKRELGKVLNEISGISYNTENNSLVAIPDSKEKVIGINLTKQKKIDLLTYYSIYKKKLTTLLKKEHIKFMPSPEGIAFAPNSDMFITNEGKYEKAGLYIFPFKSKKNK